MSKIQSDSFQRLSTFSCTPCSYSLQLLSRTKCQYLVLSPLRQTSRCPPNDRLPVDEEPIIPNLKSGTGSEHHTRKPSQHESTSIDLIMQVAYFATSANSSMANVANPTETSGIVGSQHFPWSGDIEWQELRPCPQKRKVRPVRFSENRGTNCTLSA